MSKLLGHQQGIGNEKKSWQLVSEATDFRKHDRLVPLLDACGRPNVVLWMQSYLLLAYGIGVKELPIGRPGWMTWSSGSWPWVRADWVAFVDRALHGRRRS